MFHQLPGPGPPLCPSPHSTSLTYLLYWLLYNCHVKDMLDVFIPVLNILSRPDLIDDYDSDAREKYGTRRGIQYPQAELYKGGIFFLLVIVLNIKYFNGQWNMKNISIGATRPAPPTPISGLSHNKMRRPLRYVLSRGTPGVCTQFLSQSSNLRGVELSVLESNGTHCLKAANEMWR